MRKETRKESSPLKVYLREIPPEGLTRAFDLKGDWAAATLKGTDAILEQGNELRAETELQKAQHDVFVRGRLVGNLTIPCSRCLVPAAFLLDSPFEVTFVPAGAEGDVDEDEVEVTEDLADLAAYVNDEVDLEQTLREELLLALPMAHHCRQACKGLCPSCGKNWNEGPCDCQPSPQDDRWAALRNVKL